MNICITSKSFLVISASHPFLQYHTCPSLPKSQDIDLLSLHTSLHFLEIYISGFIQYVLFLCLTSFTQPDAFKVIVMYINIHSFLLSEMPWHKCTTVSYPFTQRKTTSGLQLGQLWTRMREAFVYKTLYGLMISFISGKYHFNFLKKLTIFSRAAVLFYIPNGRVWEFQFLHILAST